MTRDDHNERLKRQEDKIVFNRFFSFQENTLSSVENRRHSINESISNLSEEDKINLNKTFLFECNQCFKIFASEYGLNFHRNMYHPNQSILCPDCNITFRSHRALKNHQQRFHFNYPENPPNYHYLSSYLYLAFSTQQFSLITKNACEQGRLPLGQLTSKLFPCQSCHLAFPSSNALKYHLLNKHEQYEYEICRSILHDIIVQVEENNKILDLNNNPDDSDNIESMKFTLAKQASIFGLVDKKLAEDIRCMKHEHQQIIFPSCQHSNRTCANLCLEYLSSYNKLIENYSYPISTTPKTNPFAQGSIVSKPMIVSSVHIGTPTKDNQKRTSLKRVQSSISERSSSPQSKRKTTDQQQQVKTNESKVLTSEQLSISPRKSASKVHHNYTRSLSSMSGNSSSSVRISSKNSRQTTVGSAKRSVSPTITLAVERSSEKRRRQREQKKTKVSPSKSRVIEQENDDDDDDDDNADIIISSQSNKQKRQREASNSSIEYVQVIHNDQQTIPSLNNIENIKLKTKNDDKDIIICDSPRTIKKSISSPNKNLSNGHQTPEYDEHVRVRCKICGDILEGRSRFSKHVLTMHSHLINNNPSNIKQQQQTTIVR